MTYNDLAGACLRGVESLGTDRTDGPALLAACRAICAGIDAGLRESDARIVAMMLLVCVAGTRLVPT